MLEMIQLENAQRLLLSSLSSCGTEFIPIANSLGRVLAKRICATLAVPPFDRSPLDGYALRVEDVQGNLPVSLKVVGEIPAGSFSSIPLQLGTAVRILTGSPLPPGADLVIRQEDTSEENDLVMINKQAVAGTGVSRAGEDIQAGEELFQPGLVIDPAVIGVLASQGIATVEVFAKPQVAIASTGDELVEVGSNLLPGQIYNTNLYTLSALIETWGGTTQVLGLVKDKAGDLAKVIESGLAGADIVVTTGGASVGAYDVTKEAMQMSGAEILFWRVAMKPGTPVICARKGGKLIIGLSGNPAAAMISASLLLGPVVRKMAGFSAFSPRKVSVRILDKFTRRSGVRRLIRARMSRQSGHLVVALPEQQQPGVLKSMLYTNALLDLPPGETFEAGQDCEAFLLNEWEEWA